MPTDAVDSRIDWPALRTKILWLSTAGHGLSVMLVVGFAVFGVRLTPEELRFIALITVPIAVVGAILTIVIFVRWTHPVSEYFAADAPSEKQRAEAFRATISIPRQLASWGVALYPFFSAIIVSGCVLHFEHFDRNLAVIVALCTSAVGIPAQMAMFTPYKSAMAAVRNRLAMEIEDPEVRKAQITPVPLARKVGMAIVSMCIITVLLIGSLAQLRTRQALEGLVLESYQRVLMKVSAEFMATDLSGELLAQVQEIYGDPLQAEFLLLDPEAEQVLGGNTDGLVLLELNYIRLSPEAGDSVQISTPHSFAWISLPDEAGILVATTSRARVIQSINSVRIAIVSLGVGVCSIAFMIAVFSNRDLSRSIAQLQNQIQRVAEGDLSRGVVFESEDEIGELGRGMDSMSSALREMVARVAHTAEEVDHAAGEISSIAATVSSVTVEQYERFGLVTSAMGGVTEQVDGIANSARSLSTSVDDSTQAASEIGSVGKELNRNANALSSKAADSDTTIQQMIVSIHAVSKTTERLAETINEASGGIDQISRQLAEIETGASETARLSESVTAAASKGQDQVDRTIKGMERIHKATETAHRVIQSLGARTDEIGSIVNVIDGVADETNLLALNAAIISAQAGEHGRAFSVVSDEVKDLADRVGASTKEIGQLIEGLQEESSNAFDAIRDGLSNVEGGVELAAEAGNALQEITVSAEESGRQVDRIVSAVHEHTVSARTVVDLMQRVGTDADAIFHATEEQSAGTETVRAASEAVGDLARQVRTTTDEQEAGSIHIAGNLEEIKDSVAGIHVAIQEQLDACHRTEQFLEELRERTSTNEESAERMTSSTKSLAEQAETLREDVRRFRF